jgi:hypothetical protein
MFHATLALHEPIGHVKNSNITCKCIRKPFINGMCTIVLKINDYLVFLDTKTNITTVLHKFLHGAKSKKKGADGPLGHIDWAIPATSETNTQCNNSFSNMDTGRCLPNCGVPVSWVDFVKVLNGKWQCLYVFWASHREKVCESHSNHDCNSQACIAWIESIKRNLRRWWSVRIRGRSVNGLGNGCHWWWSGKRAWLSERTSMNSPL